jgi:hypothetical protein
MDPIARLDAKLVALQDQVQASANAQVQTLNDMRDILKEVGTSLATLAKTQQDHEERLQRLEGKK